MTKLDQLIAFDALDIPTPAFTAVSFEDFRLDKYDATLRKIRFPVAVRSSYTAEDGRETSHAGEFLTLLHVGEADLFEAIDRVFTSYPDQEGQQVIIQEMVESDCSGVLFAFRNHVWKVEVSNENLAVTGGKTPLQTLLLPRFSRADHFWSRLFRIWRPLADGPQACLTRPMIGLSAGCGELLEAWAEEAPWGLDIEFVIRGNKVYFLQARPIPTEGEGEEVLSAANHKEILPPNPSVFMSGMIASCSRHLFSWYQRLDPGLPSRHFIELVDGMPWINLSAILDVMVHWGLPTNLVARSIGTPDVYHVRTRPYRALRKLSVFSRLVREQLSINQRSKEWINRTLKQLTADQEERRMLWFQEPGIAYNNWLTQLQLIYVDHVNLIQALTGAMSGPARLLERWGMLRQLDDEYPGARYLNAFRELAEGERSRENFLAEYGHRGFYESDIGQRRFEEYEETDWQRVLATGPSLVASTHPPGIWKKLMIRLLDPVLELVSTRETLRHETMRMFHLLRGEILEQTRSRFGETFDFSRFTPEELAEGLDEPRDPSWWESLKHEAQAGWEPDTFLVNRLGRKLSLEQFEAGSDLDHEAIGIYPGVVKGQIWKVNQASVESLQKPDFSSTILLTETLDPGWIPYFVQVDGVLSFSGGILSHASIILRESGLPSITRIPRELNLSTGDWVEMDGKTGVIRKIEQVTVPSG